LSGLISLLNASLEDLDFILENSFKKRLVIHSTLKVIKEVRVDVNRYVIPWSGGLDSTVVLDDYAATSSKLYKVIAVSVSGHPNINKHQMIAQNKAQKNYMVYAKRRGYHIEHRKIKILGKGEWDGRGDVVAQSILWLSALTPTLRDGDKILFPYIQNDCFWHYKDKFEAIFNAICSMKDVKVTFEYPLEWCTKYDVLSKGRFIPKKCWFSCDRTKNSKPCGKCDKCNEIKKAYERLKAKEVLSERSG